MHDDAHLISHPFLHELRGDLTRFNAEHWQRSKQVETGGSGLFGCRAQTVLRLNEVPKSEADWSWQAFVGSAVDASIGLQRKTVRPWLLVQERVVYRGVPCTLDEYDPEVATVRDWKTKDSAQECKEAAKNPGEQRIAQVMVAAAALIELGYPVDTVQLCFLPRSGEFTGACVWEAEFDREWADAGVDWAFWIMELAERKRQELWLADGSVDRTSLDGLRDEMPSWCYSYCPFVSICRGPSGEPDTEIPNEADLDAATRYLEAKADLADAEARKDYWESQLRFLPPLVVGGQRIAWTKDGRKWETEKDTSAIDVAEYERSVGPLPEHQVMKGRAPSLRVTRVAAPKAKKGQD